MGLSILKSLNLSLLRSRTNSALWPRAFQLSTTRPVTFKISIETIVSFGLVPSVKITVAWFLQWSIVCQLRSVAGSLIKSFNFKYFLQSRNHNISYIIKNTTNMINRESMPWITFFNNIVRAASSFTFFNAPFAKMEIFEIAEVYRSNHEWNAFLFMHH